MTKALYDFLFLLFYRWTTKVNGQDNWPIFYASLMVALLVALIAVSLLIVLAISTDYQPMSDLSGISKGVIAIFATAYFYAHTIYFEHRSRNPEISDQLKNVGDQGSTSLWLAGFLMMFSLLLFIALLFFLAKKSIAP